MAPTRVHKRRPRPSEPPYNCSDCPAQFYYKQAAGKHQRCVHLASKHNANANVKSKKPLCVCDDCSHVFYQHANGYSERAIRGTMWRHVVEKHHRIRRKRTYHVCDQCGFKSTTKDNLWWQHIVPQHTVIGKVTPLHRCDDCDAAYKFTKSALRGHYFAVHYGINIMKSMPRQRCDICEVLVRGRGPMSEHMVTAHPAQIAPKSYRCGCGKTFHNHGVYWTHRQKELKAVGKRQKVCDICDAVLMYPASDHIRRHFLLEYVVQLRCDDCEQRFYGQNILLDHQRQNGHGVYKTRMQCDNCEYNCCNRDNLMKHVLQVHMVGEKPMYRCHHCESAASEFHTKLGLIFHLKTWHDDVTLPRRYFCSICPDEGFHCKRELQQHAISEHINTL